jgi:hypothetical protein
MLAHEIDVLWAPTTTLPRWAPSVSDLGGLTPLALGRRDSPRPVGDRSGGAWGDTGGGAGAGLHPPDGRYLLVELDKADALVSRTANDRATEAERLSRQVMQVADVLVDLGLLPIEDIL